ncbi:MAG: tRNA-binding protein [Dongiaceae bacterium]
MNDSNETAPAIAYDDFRKVDIRVGTVVAVDPFPEARRPSLKLRIDFGPAIGIRQSAARLVANYRPEQLVGRQVAAVVNFPPKQIGRFMSEVLVLGFPDGQGEVTLVGSDRPVPNGGRLY